MERLAKEKRDAWGESDQLRAQVFMRSYADIYIYIYIYICMCVYVFGYLCAEMERLAKKKRDQWGMSDSCVLRYSCARMRI